MSRAPRNLDARKDRTASTLRTESLGSKLAHELRVLIVTGRLAPGTPLVEDLVAAEYDVSRGPVRDALRTLVSEGLIESRGRRGYATKGLTPEDVDDLYTLREALECQAVRLAAAHTDDSRWSILDEPLARMRDAADAGAADAYADADLDFHTCLYELAGNDRLTGVWHQFLPTFKVVLAVTNAQDLDLHPSLASHQTLADTARHGDVECAVTELREHLLGARTRLRHVITHSDQGDA